MKVAKTGKTEKLDLSTEQVKALTAQVQSEYTIAYDYLQPRYNLWDKRLKLYNNQKRDAKNVGEPMLFTVLDTLLSSLLDDKMVVSFIGREDGDQRVEKDLNLLAQYDYELMDKGELDHSVLWDALFFSYGLIDMTGFDWDKKVPMPYAIDPLKFLYDPKGSTIDGNKNGKGGMRFLGQEMYLTQRELEAMEGVYFNIDQIKNREDSNDRMQEVYEARAEAMGAEAGNKDEAIVGENKQFKLVEWRTWFEGKRVLATFANDKSLLVRVEEIKGDSWGVIAKRIWRQSHQFQGTSVGDLVEDKQRMKAILLNTGLKSLQSSLYPNYIYNSQVIKNKKDLTHKGFNKYIPSDGPVNNVVAPLPKDRVDYGFYSYLFNALDVSAQKSTATPELQQGIASQQQRTLGELNIIQGNVNTRYSSLVKSLLVGEKKFWQRWYFLYKEYFKSGIAEKILRLSGTTAPKFRKLTRDNIIATKADPDVRIESEVIGAQERQRKLAQLMQVVEMIAQDPGVDRRFLMKKVTRDAGLTPDEVDAIFPMTVDERTATKENEMLNNNKLPEVRKEDNHVMHLRIHGEANATKATYAHIEMHHKLLMMQTTNPELMQQNGENVQDEMGTQPGEKGAPNAVGAQAQQLDRMSRLTPSQDAGLET